MLPPTSPAAAASAPTDRPLAGAAASRGEPAPPVPPPDALDDRTLAGRAADGDVRAFEALVRRYAPLMRAYAARVLGSHADSDDVVQDAFVTAWSRLPDLDDGGAVKSWLMRIVSRASIDRVRARRIMDDIADHDPPAPVWQTPPRVVEARTQEQALARALAALPELQRQSWVLKEVGDYSYDDIASELGVPVSTVRGMLARARRALLAEMEEWR